MGSGQGRVWCPLVPHRGVRIGTPRGHNTHPRTKTISVASASTKSSSVAFPGYVDIGIIPVGAREIRIEEVAEAGNFLALRSEDPEKYFLNGGWTIQWNGDYRVAGTTFTYKRTGNWENLTSPGPTVEPVWIQVGWILPSL